MRCAARRSHIASGGFTLLELLVAISLLALVFALLTGGVRFGMAAWEAGSEARAMVDDRRIVQSVLLRQLQSAIALPVETTKPAGAVEFEGTRTAIRFVGRAPALAMSAGIFRFELKAEPSEDGVALTLSWRSDGPAGAGRETLATGLPSAEFAYYGDPRSGDLSQWRDTWRDALVLPQAVRLTVRSDRADDRQWPPIIVSLPGSRR